MSTRRKTRYKLRRKNREKSPISRAVREYPVGSKVHIDIDPSIHRGMPHPRFSGRTALIIGKRGRAYRVEVRDGGKTKELFVRAEHLMPAGGK